MLSSVQCSAGGAQRREDRLLCVCFVLGKASCEKKHLLGLECSAGWAEAHGSRVGEQTAQSLANKSAPGGVTQGKRHLQGGLGPLRDFECRAKEFGLWIYSLIFRDLQQ